MSGKNVSSLKIRILSSLVLAPLAIAIIYAGGWAFLILLALATMLALREWWGMARAGSQPWLAMAIGIFYLLLSGAFFLYLRLGFPTGAWLTAVLVLVVAASDIGAYFTGRALGGPKLITRLSPKKTWAGLFGAMIWAGGLLTGAVWGESYIDIATPLSQISLWLVFVFGMIMGVAGQAGDLLVSYFKRRSGLKDTGHLIPGHGGILDRIDALLLVCPLFVTILILLL